MGDWAHGWHMTNSAEVLVVYPGKEIQSAVRLNLELGEG